MKDFTVVGKPCRHHFVRRLGLPRVAGVHPCFAKSTRNSTIFTPSLSRSFLCREAYGSGISNFPRSPTTRCHGIPFPEGVAAKALPAVLAPPRKCNALASAP